MGTNYYLLEDNPAYNPFDPDNPFLGLTEPKMIYRHIGNSSKGWVFSLHMYPEDGIHTWRHWAERLHSSARIVNEYGEQINWRDMIDIITQREHERGLKRHEVDGVHCVSHGEGTYDYIVGDFS